MTGHIFWEISRGDPAATVGFGFVTGGSDWVAGLPGRLCLSSTVGVCLSTFTDLDVWSSMAVFSSVRSVSSVRCRNYLHVAVT